MTFTVRYIHIDGRLGYFLYNWYRLHGNERHKRKWTTYVELVPYTLNRAGPHNSHSCFFFLKQLAMSCCAVAEVVLMPTAKKIVTSHIKYCECVHVCYITPLMAVFASLAVPYSPCNKTHPPCLYWVTPIFYLCRFYKSVVTQTVVC